MSDYPQDPDGASSSDAQEQQTPAYPDTDESTPTTPATPRGGTGPFDTANEADQWEQSLDVPVDDDEYPTGG